MLRIIAAVAIFSAAQFGPIGAVAAPYYAVLHNLSSNEGIAPAFLVNAPNGDIYGIAYTGGNFTACPTFGCGTIFRISPAGEFKVIHAFTGGASDGSKPLGELMVASDGKIYGVTREGGSANVGTVYRINKADEIKIVYSFKDDAAREQYPTSGVTQGADGYLYGTTSSGAVFKLSLSGSETILGYVGSGTGPGRPIFGLDGSLYGTRMFGGTNFAGSVYKITMSGAVSTLHSFNPSIGEGSLPGGGLMLSSDGYFYGTTISGGNIPSCENCGTLFRISSSGEFKTMHSFKGLPDDGSYPDAVVPLEVGKKIYGTTRYGGLNDRGTIFTFMRNKGVSLYHSFDVIDGDGYQPYVGLFRGAKNKLYGTTTSSADGTGFFGTIYVTRP